MSVRTYRISPVILDRFMIFFWGFERFDILVISSMSLQKTWHRSTRCNAAGLDSLIPRWDKSVGLVLSSRLSCPVTSSNRTASQFRWFARRNSHMIPGSLSYFLFNRSNVEIFSNICISACTTDVSQYLVLKNLYLVDIRSFTTVSELNAIGPGRFYDLPVISEPSASNIYVAFKSDWLYRAWKMSHGISFSFTFWIKCIVWDGLIRR